MATDTLAIKPMPAESKIKVLSLERELSSNVPAAKSQTTVSGANSKEKKIGHRRVDDAGQVTYKKTTTSELMAAIQLGISHSISKLSPKPKRDVLYGDFHIVESIFFPREGSNLTPGHKYSDFRFKTYAPIAFRYFRDLFGIQPDDFLLSLCNEPLQELSNPGASGSIFYITNDDEFIIKTVQHKEAEFLQKLLPGYYMNLNQNPRTLLPKFYGLYCYQCGGKNIRFVVMNNLLPSSILMHAKYDLKGSTFKRKASKQELTKHKPTYKDLNFLEHHADGILLEMDTYSALLKTVERDCRVLQSFKIMDYSMLLGIHNLDQSAKDKALEPSTSGSLDASALTPFRGLSRGKSVRHRLAHYSTAMESIQAASEPLDIDDSEDIPVGGIPARSVRGERLLIYIGIIDILQSYRLAKKFEHTLKSMVTDGDTISVHRPGFYAQRFQNFFANLVFKKIPSPLRHTPSKRKSVTDRQKSFNELDTSTFEKSVTELEQGAVGGRPDVLPSSLTPLPPYRLSAAPKKPSSDVIHERHSVGSRQTESFTTIASSSSSNIPSSAAELASSSLVAESDTGIQEVAAVSSDETFLPRSSVSDIHVHVVDICRNVDSSSLSSSDKTYVVLTAELSSEEILTRGSSTDDVTAPSASYASHHH